MVPEHRIHLTVPHPKIPISGTNIANPLTILELSQSTPPLRLYGHDFPLGKGPPPPPAPPLWRGRKGRQPPSTPIKNTKLTHQQGYETKSTKP